MLENKPLLSLVIPCYNEADNIPLIFQRLKEIMPTDLQMEVVLVNNGSKDNSREVFRTQLELVGDTRFKVVEVPVNQGYGFGILSGLAAAKANVLAWTHADMQTDPKDVLTAYDVYIKANNSKVFVKGKRKSRALGPQFFTTAMGLLASWALKQRLDDIGAQPKLFSREFYEAYLKDNAPKDFSLDLFAQFWAQKEGKIVDFPVYFAKRLHGEAKGGGSLTTRIKVSKRVWKFIFELKKHLKV